MTVFGEARLGRMAYAAMLILLFCFDFAKAPIQHYLMAQHDQAIRDLSSPAVMARKPEANPIINGKPMPLMPKGGADVLRDIAASGRKPTEADMEKLRAAAQAPMADLSIDPEVQRLVDRRALFEGLHIANAIAMTAITVIGLLWMVSSRLRDIGASQSLLWVLLAPVFIPKFVAIPLSTLAVEAITVFFFGVLLLLAVIPAAGSGPIFPKRPPPAPAPVAAAKPRSGQFGKLGSP